MTFIADLNLNLGMFSCKANYELGEWDQQLKCSDVGALWVGQ